MIRKDLKDFPFERRNKSVWYILINFEKKTLKDFYSVADKSNLVSVLKKILDNKNENNFKLLGSWLGEWSADSFEIPIKKAHSKLSKEF